MLVFPLRTYEQKPRSDSDACGLEGHRSIHYVMGHAIVNENLLCRKVGKAGLQPLGVLPRLTGSLGISHSSTLCEMSQFLPWLFSQLYPLFDIQASTLFVLAVFPPVRCPSLYPVCSRSLPPCMMSKLLRCLFSQSSPL